MTRKCLSLLLLVLLFCMPMFGCGKKAEPPETEPPVSEDPDTPTPPPDPRVTVETVDPVCVVINNHKAANPHSGLQEAKIVYEFLVEGGITRFLAVYNRPADKNVVIGPVRSLRTYFAETAKEYGSVIAYSGMSARTSQWIVPLKLKQITDTGSNFWRDKNRNAPHNLYTDLERLYKARGTSEVKSETFLPEELPAGNEGREFGITYSKDQIVNYVYSDETGMYLRSQNGKQHKDRETGLQYAATRVIVRKNKHTAVSGSDLFDIIISGSGTATLYEAGQQYEITWEKTGTKTVYLFKDGKEVDLRAGHTWIQVVR